MVLMKSPKSNQLASDYQPPDKGESEKLKDLIDWAKIHIGPSLQPLIVYETNIDGPGVPEPDMWKIMAS